MKISKEGRYGIFLTIAAIILIWGVNFLKGKNILRFSQEYYILYDKIEGLDKSSPVTINGYKIGQVEDIELQYENGKILVIIALNEDFPLRRNATAEIYSSDIMGTREVRIIPGKDNLYHEDGDTLLSKVEQSLQEQVSKEMLPLKGKAEDLMKSFDSVLVIIQSTFNQNFRDNFGKSFEKIRNTLTSVERSTYTLDTILTDPQSNLQQFLSNLEQISSKINNNSDNLELIIQNIESITDSIAKSELKSTINNTSKVLTEAKGVLEKINNGEGSLGLFLQNDTLYRNLEKASEDLDMLLKDIRINPKKYLNFSVIDLGKTVYIIEKEDNKKKKGKNRTTD